MKRFSLQFVFLASILLATGLLGCSKDNNELDTPTEPTNPPSSITTVPLTQFEVMLDNQVTQGKANNRSPLMSFPETDLLNNPKTTFSAGDHFIFSYSNTLESSQKAYAYSLDGKNWKIHEKEDSNSPVKTIQLDAKSPALSASYLPISGINAGADMDGIITDNIDGKLTVGCFDVLRATANITVTNNKAIATIPFRHVNHLLNFYIRGTINENVVNRLELKVTYPNASGTQQDAVLLTSSRAEYADIEGKKHTVIQAIVPRNGVVKGIKAICNDNEIVLNTVNINCPSEKSHLITLNVNENTMSAQIGSLIDYWAFSGEMNPDGSPIGDIFIANETELRGFAGAVNIDPNMPAARINGILAYTANVVQTADIDLSNLDWRPIGGNAYNDGYNTTYFAGTYNGNGYKISGMRVSSNTVSGHSVASYAGLFGKVQSPEGGYAVLTNIQLVNININLNKSIYQIAAGGLAGYIYAPIGKNPVVISNCSAQGSISVTNQSWIITAGGLVGEATNTHITGSSTNVSVITKAEGNSHAGGIIGRSVSSIAASSYAQNTVSGESLGTSSTSWAGGITGTLITDNLYSYVIACSSDGNVTSKGKRSFAGGLVGSNGGNIIGCYARGKATATGTTAKWGAIVGDGAFESTLCYGTGEGGAGNSDATAKANDIVYNTNPASGAILSIISGEAWKTSHDGVEMGKATLRGILTTIPINNADNKLIQEVKTRTWILSDPKAWKSTNPASAVYPLPATNYKGDNQ